MRSRFQQHVFLVDDEPRLLAAARETLESIGLKVTCFSRGSDCLNQIAGRRCDLLVTDVRMPGVDGMALLEETRHVAPWLPVLIFTAYGDVEMTAKAFKGGVSDFIQKPFDRETLIFSVRSILEKRGPVDGLLGKPLSRMEMMVLRHILAGKSNKETARILNRSERTVENHRSRLMRKLGVDNVVDLCKRAQAMGLI
ncbi:MAG: response regulator transcription factor [Phycisphaerales bacterium]|nr:MAG: response regulator transcription factor [Phycisphaerales bacterium]